MKLTKKKIILIVVVLLLAASPFVVPNLFGKKSHELTYQEVSVTRGKIQNTILSTGLVQPENRLEVKPPIPGRIEQVLVEEGQIVKIGDKLAWMSSTERAALLDTAKSKGKRELKYWEDAYKATPLIAPIDGVIILKNVEQGQTVTATDAILVMSDRLIVKAQVDETDIGQIKNEQAVKITLDAYADHPLNGKVVHIAYEAKTVNNVTTYEVDVLAEKVPEFMKSGMTANVTFVTAENENALLLPASAVKREKGKFSVLVPNPGGEPKTVEVEVGVNDGKEIEIADGLSENDKVLMPKIQTGRSKDGKANNPFAPTTPGKGKK